jgi:ribosomal-protein-alanine N-acetyltransferase
LIHSFWTTAVIANAAVRFATLADAAGIAAMSRELIEHGLPWRWRRERVASAIRDADTNVVVVGEPGAIIAFGLMAHADDDAHLLLFAVSRAHQRRGIGSALLLWLEAVARSAGARRIRVEARRDNEAARCFYNEHGYHERALRRAMYSARMDGVLLEKWLRQAGSAEAGPPAAGGQAPSPRHTGP